MRERSERKTSVFNQKTMFLGYAHSSSTKHAHPKETHLGRFLNESKKCQLCIFFRVSK
ncbi:MAG: hypothetical protein U5L45_14365 [Saprospiraceae bacterium]|nr:hypothetical protein [Saprospiraceae bacterium]